MQTQDPLSKSLPHNIDAERSVLGAILLDNKSLDRARDKITPDDFFHDHHRRIFAAMLALGDLQEPIDLLTLTDKLESVKQLESSGGAAYISQLMDNVPHVSNVEHYCKIIHEKAQLRALIHTTNAIQLQAFDGSDPTGEILTHAADLMANLTTSNGHGRKKLHPVTMADLLLMDLRPVEFVIDPILPVQGLGELFAPRGMGKTFVGLEIAFCVAVGEKKCFSWDVPKARRVVYVDGEMAANRVQGRLRSIALGHGLRMPPDPSYIRIITRDLEDREVCLNISTREGQRNIEEHLMDGDFLLLDNLSCLTSGGKENEGDDWVPVAGWLLRLRQRGITVLFIHHAGKGGEQRGTSRREDLLDCVIAMRKAAEHSASELRCEIHIDKLRNAGPAESVFPFELTMRTDERGAILWLRRPLKEVIEQNALRMFSDGMSIRDVAEELHITKHRAVKIKNSAVKLPE